VGRHVPPGVRILSLRDYPEQQWVDLRQAVIDPLKAENEPLMRRLKELEESGVRVSPGGDGGELVPRGSEQGKEEEARGCGQTEGEAAVDATTRHGLSFLPVPRPCSIPPIPEGVYVQKRRSPRSHAVRYAG
jgi:hypothetical protein